MRQVTASAGRARGPGRYSSQLTSRRCRTAPRSSSPVSDCGARTRRQEFCGQVGQAVVGRHQRRHIAHVKAPWRSIKTPGSSACRASDIISAVLPARIASGQEFLCPCSQRRLTTRSSRAPTAWRTSQQALGLRPILRLLSGTPRCRCRLSSNVMHHTIARHRKPTRAPASPLSMRSLRRIRHECARSGHSCRMPLRLASGLPLAGRVCGHQSKSIKLPTPATAVALTDHSSQRAWCPFPVPGHRCAGRIAASSSCFFAGRQ